MSLKIDDHTVDDGDEFRSYLSVLYVVNAKNQIISWHKDGKEPFKYEFNSLFRSEWKLHKKYKPTEADFQELL